MYVTVLPMHLLKLFLLLLAVVFFSTCKKETIENSTPSYPIFYEFDETDNVETNIGLIKSFASNDLAIIQNVRYNPIEKISEVVHYSINDKTLTGGEIIKKAVTVDTKVGNDSRVGNLAKSSINNQFHYGLFVLNKPFVSGADYTIVSYQNNLSILTQPIRKIADDIELKKLITVNGGYLLIGTKMVNGSKDLLIIKYKNNTLFKEWEKSIGTPGEDVGLDAIQLCDNNYGVLAYTNGKGAGDRDVWFIKINENGSLIFDKTFGGAGYEEPQKILSDFDCGLYIVGHSASFGAPEHDGYILKINENGTKEWEKTFGTPYHDGFNTATHIPDTKTFIAAGRSMQEVGQHEDIFVVCFDEKGNELWRKKYGDPNLTELPQEITANKEFYYIASNRVDANNNYTSVFIKDRLGN